MNQHIRILIKQHWGTPSPPGLALNYNSDVAWQKAAAAVGGRSNLRLYGEHSTGNSSGNRLAAIGLDHYVIYESDFNTSGAWTMALGTPDYFEQLPRPFRENVPGVSYKFAGDAAARFLSNFDIAANAAFAVRTYLFKPAATSSNKRHLVAWQVGTAAGGGYRLEIIDGKMSLCQLKATWNQADQSTLDAAREDGGGITQVEQDAIDTLMASQFESVTPLDIGLDAEGIYNRALEIKWLAEPRGRVHIVVTGVGEATVENTAILATGAAGTLWAAGPLSYSVNRGATFWQRGTVKFRAVGKLILPPFRWWYQTTVDQLAVVHNGQMHAPAGTAIAFDFANAAGLFPNLYADFTSNGDATGFLYTIATFAPAGERVLPETTPNGTDLDTIWFDSDEWPNIEILSLEPSCEGENRRVSLHVRMGNPENMLELPMGGLDFSDRQMFVELGGQPWLGNLTIRNVTVGPLAAAHRDAANGDFSPVLRPDSEIEFTAHDLYHRAEKDLMSDDPVLDGLPLGTALRLVWRGLGLTSGELAGIPNGSGPIIGTAGLGEAPKARPQKDTPRADFVRFLMSEFGLGWGLHCYTGGPVLYQTSALTSIRTFQPGELESVEITHDNTDVKNHFPVEGANGVATAWTITESFRAPDWPGFTGAIARAATLSDEGLRNENEALGAARASSRVEGKPGLFLSAHTSFDPRLLPGRVITAWGVDYVLERVQPGELAHENQLGFTARRKIPLP